MALDKPSVAASAVAAPSPVRQVSSARIDQRRARPPTAGRRRAGVSIPAGMITNRRPITLNTTRAAFRSLQGDQRPAVDGLVAPAPRVSIPLGMISDERRARPGRRATVSIPPGMISDGRAWRTPCTAGRGFDPSRDDQRLLYGLGVGAAASGFDPSRDDQRQFHSVWSCVRTAAGFDPSRDDQRLGLQYVPSRSPSCFDPSRDDQRLATGGVTLWTAAKFRSLQG